MFDQTNKKSGQTNNGVTESGRNGLVNAGYNPGRRNTVTELSSNKDRALRQSLNKYTFETSVV